MKTIFKVCLYLLVFSCSHLFAQNSSNKGVDFWIGFPAHGDGNRADMYLYITGDSNTTGTVSIPGQSWSSNFTVTAYNMTLVSIPANLAYVGCNDCIQARGIHVVTAKKVAVYSHIYYQYRSDATLVLPTPTTGKEYFAMSYEQNGPSIDRSQFMVVASKDDTKVRITPTVDLSSNTGGTLQKNQSYEIILDAGEVYQGRAKNRSATDDVTGTHIEVIDTGANAGCKTVAVFSGSSNAFLGCSSSGGGIASRDNLYQQLYPTRAWGTRFVTIPFKSRTADEIRILAAEANTNIVINHQTGTPTTLTLNAGEFYDLNNVNQTKYIFASKPICVAQYQQSQKCGGTGDPSMTILSPIEQTLKQISVYSSQYEAISVHYINVIIHNSGTSSFKIDGNSVTFTKVPKLPSYSYAQISVTKGVHRMTSDVGFNAIAYGFGGYESYGYAAGANVKDLTAKMELVNSAEQDVSSICLGTKAEFEGQAEYKVSKWIWDLGDGTKDTGQFIEHEYKQTGLFNVILYTYKESYDGCSTYDSSELEIRVNAMPTAKFVTSSRCEGSTVNFTDSSTAPAGESILSRQWIFGNSTPIYAQNSSKYYDTAGTYKVTLIAKTDFQCSDTLTLDLVINPNPVPGITVDDVCYKDSTKFINSTTVKTGKIGANKWYFGDGDSSTAYSPTHFYKDSGYYYVTLNTTTDSGCSGTIMDTLYKYPSFTLSFKHSDTCVGLGLNFTNTSTTTAGVIDGYFWKFPSTTYSTKDAQHTFSTPGTYKVKLFGTLFNYCRDSVERTVIVDPKVAGSFTMSGGCMADTAIFTNTSTVPTGSVAQISWVLDAGVNRTGNLVKHKYTSNGTKNISMIAVSDAGCSDTIKKTLTIRNPRITGMNLPLACAGKTIKLSGIYSLDTDTIKSYNWSVSNGASGTSDTLTFSSILTGKYVVTHTINTKNNCTLVKKDSFDMNAVPIPNFTVADICQGLNIAPLNTSTITSVDALSFVWYFNGSQISTVKNPTIMANPTGNGNIRLVVNSSKGCSDEISKNITIYPLPKAGFTYSDTCLGMPINFFDNSNISSGSIATYNWSFNDGTANSGTTINRNYLSAGNYSLKHIVISDFGCKDSITRNFNIAPKPTLDFTPDKNSGCEPLMVNFTNNSSVSPGAISSYNWDFGDGNTSTVATPSNIYASAGNYTVTLIATSAANCSDTLKSLSPIDILPSPTAAFTYTPLEPSLLFPDVNFINGSSPDATSFSWNVGDGTTYATFDVNHKYLNAGDYDIQLIVTADNGCKDTAVELVHLKLDFFIWIPTVFSPNGDNTNDVFRVHGVIPDMKGYTIEIFNRWGQVLFKTDNQMLTWDGKFDGKEVPAGTYGYVVRYINYETGRWESKKGSISIIR